MCSALCPPVTTDQLQKLIIWSNPESAHVHIPCCTSGRVIRGHTCHDVCQLFHQTDVSFLNFLHVAFKIMQLLVFSVFMSVNRLFKVFFEKCDINKVYVIMNNMCRPAGGPEILQRGDWLDLRWPPPSRNEIHLLCSTGELSFTCSHTFLIILHIYKINMFIFIFYKTEHHIYDIIKEREANKMR